MRNTWADKWHASQIAKSREGFEAGEMDLALYERFVALRKRGLIGPLLVECGRFRIGVDEITGSWAGSRPVSLDGIRTVIRCIERDNPEMHADDVAYWCRRCAKERIEYGVAATGW